jgi:hypothetical protein
MKLGTETGSLFNHLMGSSKSEPEVGKGATVLYWTDRSAYQVIWVSDDKKSCKIQRCKAKRIDSNGMSESQDYDYSELEENSIETLVFKWGSWRTCVKVVNYSDYEKLTKDEIELCQDSDCLKLKLIPGLTKETNVYNKINILFGVQREYHDYSF